MKKAICSVLLLIMIFLLCSCTDTSAKIGTINKKGVTVEEFNYFLYTVKAELLDEAEVNKENSEEFWQTELEGKKAIELAKEKAFEETMSFEAKYLKATEYGYKINREIKKTADAEYENLLESHGGKESFKALLQKMGMSEKAYKEILTKSACITAFLEENSKQLTQGELDAEKESTLGEMWKSEYTVTRNEHEFSKIK